MTYTEEDVRLVAEALGRDFPLPDRGLAGRFAVAAEAALDALAAAGRLVPAEAQRAAALCGLGYIYINRRTGEQHVLNPVDVIVVLPEGQQMAPKEETRG